MTVPAQEESQVINDLLALADSASDDLTAARIRDLAVNYLVGAEALTGSASDQRH